MGVRYVEEMQISVICNTYNQEKYIRSALDGFVMQKTNFPFEVLIHDDASQDKTPDIIREYESRYPAIIKAICDTENQWSKHDGSLRRIAMERAGGKYVALCEGDDYWTDPYKLQKQYDFMESHPDYTLCGCSTVWLNELSGKDMGNSKTSADKDVRLEEFLLPSNSRPFPTVSFLIKTDVWKSLPKWGFPVGDLPLTYFCAMKGKVRMLADTMCVYRWNAEGSWTAKSSDPEKRAQINEKMIAAYETMNQQTDYAYDELIKKAILHQKYTLALMRRDFAAITGPELIGMYKSRSFIYRMSDYFRCKNPGMYRQLQKLLKKNR